MTGGSAGHDEDGDLELPPAEYHLDPAAGAGGSSLIFSRPRASAEAAIGFPCYNRAMVDGFHRARDWLLDHVIAAWFAVLIQSERGGF